MSEFLAAEEKVVILQARMLFVQVRLAGMMAENELHTLEGDPPVYVQRDFDTMLMESGISGTSFERFLTEDQRR